MLSPLLLLVGTSGLNIDWSLSASELDLALHPSGAQVHVSLKTKADTPSWAEKAIPGEPVLPVRRLSYALASATTPAKVTSARTGGGASASSMGWWRRSPSGGSASRTGFGARREPPAEELSDADKERVQQIKKDLGIEETAAAARQREP